MSETLRLSMDRMATPIGEMLLVADLEGNLRAIDWSDHEKRIRRLLRLHYGEDGFKLEPSGGPSKLRDAINNYFAGELTAIDTLAVKTAGTSFQRDVWRPLRTLSAAVLFLTGSLPNESAGQLP